MTTRVRSSNYEFIYDKYCYQIFIFLSLVNQNNNKTKQTYKNLRRVW